MAIWAGMPAGQDEERSAPAWAPGKKWHFAISRRGEAADLISEGLNFQSFDRDVRRSSSLAPVEIEKQSDSTLSPLSRAEEMG